MTYREIYEAGFTDLVSVIPPGAILSPLSKITPEALGKIPGRLTGGGWVGYDWLKVGFTPASADLAEQWGASLGLRAKFFPAFDIDCTNGDLAQFINWEVTDRFGRTAQRWGNKPKHLLIYRTAVPFPKRRLWFKDPLGVQQLLEVLGDGQQYVIEGIHPKTQAPYEWAPMGLDAFPIESIPQVTVEDVDTFLVELSETLTTLGCTDVSLESKDRRGAPVALQEALAGDLAQVTAWIQAIPNTTDAFPGREDCLTPGYALKAALPDDPDAAFDLWVEWLQRWTGGDNSLVWAQEQWHRMRGPFAVGAGWLRDRAQAAGFNTAASDFTPTGPAPVFMPTPERKAIKSGAVEFSDAWFAARLVDQYGERIRFCEQRGGWLVWDGHRWAADETGRVVNQSAKVCRTALTPEILALYPSKEATRAQIRSASVDCRNATLNYAKVDPRIALPAAAFDADPWALNTPGGVLNLKTGVLTPPDSSRLFTHCTAVAPSASQEHPKWSRFLGEVTGEDRDLQVYLQRLVGYCLTGTTIEHVFAFFYGSGGNGKGRFVHAVTGMLGSYARAAGMDTFTAARFDKHPADLATLVGARLVTAQETQEGRSWDEAKVKAITGGDEISARFMRENPFTFIPQFKLLFAGNHRPHIQNLDDAMRRRLQLVPFTKRPSVVNPDLDEELEAEWPAILQWAVEGCLAWQRGGLQPPAAVRSATDEYFESEDAIGRWLAERTLPDAQAKVPVSELYADWRTWAGEQGESVGTTKAFSLALLARGTRRAPGTAVRAVLGVKLQPAFTPMGAAAALLN